jgi:putative membrane-bound dehydrogenase-like protein
VWRDRITFTTAEYRLPASGSIIHREFPHRDHDMLNSSTSVCSLAALMWMIVSAPSTVIAQPGHQPVQLFDGATLTGWEGDRKYWRVEGGAIVGEIPKGQSLGKNTWLVWRGGELADFDLRLQFKLSGLPAANSGIQFRCQVDNVDHVSGYQADLDMGATWLGRIYDEHGRALLVERGSRVSISEDGTRQTEAFAPANQYAVLFRERDWNEYRIVAVGDRISVFINGTLFSELRDQQAGERDLKGSLAFQLHSGPETRIEFRNITLESLRSDDQRLKPFRIQPQPPSDPKNTDIVPIGEDGKAHNLGFETGTLSGWTATGNAFKGQPVKTDGISQRWQGQVSNKDGMFFIGGYEIVQDAGTGTLQSVPFRVTHPYGSFLVSGGETPATRVDVVQVGDDGNETVVATASGRNREQMQRVAIDLRAVMGKRILIRLVDENPGGWGHLNFDDFRFHDTPPANVEKQSAWRSTFSPLLQHLVPNSARPDPAQPGTETTAKMFVPEGFSVDVIAAEPNIHQPMAFTFDARGRMWVVEGHSYPQKRPEGEGLDRILIFADRDHDGTFENRTLFAEGLNLVSGLEVGHGGVWVGAAPQLLFIPDRNGDDKPDSEPQVLLDGFGYADTHETLNSFMWGPDGWLYGNQGVFNTSKIGRPGAKEDQRTSLSAGVWRYHPTKHQFEVFAHGGSNQWGLDYDEHGQVFMTYCRSFWGRGDTTHVMQGGHYWNQVNAGYAPFISAQAIPGRPWMVNYLLASARYGHGEGGSGKPGSNDVYGGHSHVGTMIYLGDNWPAEFRNRLFTHNLHGHQMNQQNNRREAGGYNTIHAGADMLFCSDQQYIGVDLQYGPDGAVYINDWYDPRHCHSPNAEQWERGNGRMYRMKYDATWKPASVDYATATDDALVAAHLHRNEWHVRMARLELSGRASQRGIASSAVTSLEQIAQTHDDPVYRLRALWTLHCIDKLSSQVLQAALNADSEYLRAWGIQLGIEAAGSRLLIGNFDLGAKLVFMAQKDESLFVRRYLASAVGRIGETGWIIAEAICARSDSTSDRDLPLLLWHNLAPLVLEDVDRALQLAETSRIPAIADDITWYAAANSEITRERLLTKLTQQDGQARLRLLETLQFAVQDARHLRAPASWKTISQSLYDSDDHRVVSAAEVLGVAFDDVAAYDRIRQRIAGGKLSRDQLLRSLRMLSGDTSPDNLPLYLQLLSNKDINAQVIPLLAQFNSPSVGDELLNRLPQLQDAGYSAAMEALCSRASWANRLLDRIADGTLPKSHVTAYSARQMASLGDSALKARLEKEWGRLGQTSAEVKADIAKLAVAYKSAPLWAYSDEAGAAHFKKLCAQCHLPNAQTAALGPKLTGSGTKGIEYLVENVLDPNAVIGRDYQARIIQTASGRVLTGLVEKETETSITIRTLNESVTIAKDDIEESRVSENSFMPEGLLKPLNDREKIELLKYLMRQ